MLLTADDLYPIWYEAVKKRESYGDWYTWLYDNYHQCQHCDLYESNDSYSKIQARGDDYESEWYICDDCWPVVLARKEELDRQAEELYQQFVQSKQSQSD